MGINSEINEGEKYDTRRSGYTSNDDRNARVKL